ncbi:MAG: hypothetical protein JSS76_05175 [Bacteroidetes bacterium]|nr:hypothetical protein [Bacteroidota bacterium]
MADKKKIKAPKTKEEIFDEIRKLSEQADDSTSHQVDMFKDLGDEDIDSTFDTRILNDTANPDEAHRLYYNIQRVLIDNLPKGDEHKKLRQKIYDEKNLFLSRGYDKDAFGIRGRDGRQTYIGLMQEAFKYVFTWVASGGNAFDIYSVFWEVNESKGYHKEEPPKEEAKSDGTFDDQLKGLLNTPPPKKDSDNK